METTKLSTKGQIVIPESLRRGFAEGTVFTIARKDDLLFLKKVDGDDFRDILLMTEYSLKEMWDNPSDEIWNEYLK